jgi:uncharacterized protein (TIGR03437 family)
VSVAPGRLRAGGLGSVLVLCLACGTSGPHIDEVSPPTAARGAAVRIDGDGFCSGACDGTAGYVDFGLDPPMVRARVTAWSATRIDVVVPESVATGATDVIVTVDGESSNAVAFEVQ